jgi:hypothetical protein
VTTIFYKIRNLNLNSSVRIFINTKFNKNYIIYSNFLNRETFSSYFLGVALKKTVMPYND